MANIREKDKPRASTKKKPAKSVSKPVIYIAVALVILLVMVVIFNPNRESRRLSGRLKNSPAATSSEPEFVKQGELTFFKTDSTAIVKIDIEIADNDETRERGLMYRRQMDLNRGMLFVFDDEDLRSFWMKNTYLPLDILYLNAQKKIIRIHENVAILNEQSIPSDSPAKYVVEVNAGFCALNNIQTGDVMNYNRK